MDQLAEQPRAENSDDASSVVSVGTDLKDDLENAFGGDFDFKGEYAYANSLPSAPNPGLHIDGLGLVGLPLSERDAKLIAGCAIQAPFGHGDRTVVDTKVRDTFEIEPSRVTFSNPLWEPFITQTVAKTAWTTLGVAAQKTLPRCELYKLLLYQTGSHFLPHQDTEKADGMFATIIVVLPSLYSGGQVHVSHGSSRKTFDLSSTSAFTTSFLTWYTDVVHEVKPIMSGYRLALSYNLIHTSPGIPRPTLPNFHGAVSRIHHILHKWSKGAYDASKGHTDIVAYLLEHQYSQHNLKMGALKGKDAHLVANIRAAAEEEDFMIGLANLEYHVTGAADDDGPRYRRGWGGYSSEESEGGTPGMLEEYEHKLSVKNLVDLDGFSIMGDKDLGISNEHLIPENPFEDADPDNTEYEGYMGNGAGSLEYWYHRTVLVLFPGEKEMDILLRSGGVSYALQRLKRGGTMEPSEEDRTLAKFVVDRINTREIVPTQAMSDYAVTWNDTEMWCQVVKAGGADKNPDILDKSRLMAAWRKFSFKFIQPTLEAILENSKSLRARLDLINGLSELVPDEDRENTTSWFSERTSSALETLKNPSNDDVPVLMSLIRSKGLQCFSDSIMPKLLTKSSTAYEFWMAFIPAFRQEGRLLQQPLDQEQSQPQFEAVLHRCLSIAVQQWDSPVAHPRTSYGYGYAHQTGHSTASASLQASRVVRLAELCLTVNHPKLCDNLLAAVLKSSGDFSSKLITLYAPLISALKQMLARQSVDFSIYPFCDFLRAIIRQLLAKSLGEKPPSNRAPKIRRIGCGCSDCNSVNQFLASSSATITQQTFRLAQRRRTHLEIYLKTASDLVSYTVVRSGSPHGLAVTKRPEIVALAQWTARSKAARDFLAKIGDDALIAKIMGSQYGDVAKALEGTQPFKLTPPAVAQATSPSTGPTTQASASSSSQSPGVCLVNVHQGHAHAHAAALVPAPVPVAPLSAISTNVGQPATIVVGQKRKSTPEPVVARQKRKETPEVNGDVLDLTGDSP